MGAQQLEVKQSADAKKPGKALSRLELGMLPGLIGYQLLLAQRAIFADFAKNVGDDIGPGLFGILVVIEANPGLKQQRLAEAAHLDRSTVVAVIDKLESRGLVERRAADRRSNGLYLTAQGAELLRSLKRKVQQHERRVLQRLTPQERDELSRLLDLILPERR